MTSLPIAAGCAGLLALFSFLPSSVTPPQAAGDPHRQFDFWLGEWECFTQAGALAGTNRIELSCGGKVLEEHWKGTGGSVGTSLNIYDAQTRRWHQTWVDAGGTLLLLDGELQEDGAMLLEGTRPTPGGGEVLHRIVWMPEEDGEVVRQTWTSSGDEGKTWRTLADLDYRRPAPEESAEAEDAQEQGSGSR